MPARLLPRAAALVMAIGLLTACAPEPEPEPTPAPEPAAASPSPTPAPEQEAISAPLTGIEVDTAIAAPSLAVKIDNQSDALPQVGLESTDLVYEELVEGGLTRYVAVWHSNVPAEVGPVRSIRPMDPAIIAPLGGIVSFSGGQPHFVAAMQATGLVNAIHGGEHDAYFSRTNQRIAPHDVMLQASRIVQDNASVAPPQPQFQYAAEGAAPTSQAPGGGPATQASLAFSESQSRSWTCDAGTGRWMRFQQGDADMTASGEQLSAANVVVLRVQVESNGNVPQTMLEGRGGEGFAMSGCSWVPVTWTRGADLAAPIQVVDGAGEPVVLAPGNSWIELVPTTGAASVG